MKKADLLKVVNPAVGVVFLAQALSGIFHSAIPWEVFHYGHGLFGYFLVVLVLIHIFLNWSWIKANYFKKKNNNFKTKTEKNSNSISKEA